MHEVAGHDVVADGNEKEPEEEHDNVQEDAEGVHCVVVSLMLRLFHRQGTEQVFWRYSNLAFKIHQDNLPKGFDHAFQNYRSIAHCRVVIIISLHTHVLTANHVISTLSSCLMRTV